MQERTKLHGLTAARFYAALLIVVYHVAAMPQLPLPPYLQFINGHFALGVQLFFVISAFSLFIGYFGKMAESPQVRDYAIRRFFRIAPLFYVMMAIYVGYRDGQYGVSTEWGHIITSATFTFNFFPRYVEGFVWASWTIGIEMAFYCLVPLLISFITTLRRALALFFLSALLGWFWALQMKGAGGDMLLFRNYFFIAHLVYFAGGIAAYFVWLKLPKERTVGVALIAAGTVSFVGLIAFRTELADQIGRGLVKPLQTIPLALFVLGLAISPVIGLVNRFTTRLGEASFSLYLFHPLIIGVLMASGFFKRVYAVVDNSAMAFTLCVIVVFAILVPLSLLGYRFIELPGNRLGARLIARLHRRDPDPLRRDTAIAPQHPTAG